MEANARQVRSVAIRVSHGAVARSLVGSPHFGRPVVTARTSKPYDVEVHGRSMAPAPTPFSPPSDRRIGETYRDVRAFTQSLCRPLDVEDYGLQSMPSCSPAKWHLAHTTWFFETFVLNDQAGYRSPNPSYAHLFNSYYESVGSKHPRPQRGLLSRPTVTEITHYRAHVDEAILASLAGLATESLALVTLGLHHEQQHQELILMDLKHAFACNPLGPRYQSSLVEIERTEPNPERWVDFDAGLIEIGHTGSAFAFDNEGPRHRVYLQPYSLGASLVTNAQFQDFIDDDGYRRPELWLSKGWDTALAEGWGAPLYWRRGTSGWEHFTLGGWRPVDAREPVCHVSYFEADAYARWRGARLPSEFEWEHAAHGQPIEGQFAETGRYHPAPAAPTPGLAQMYGDLWQWTRSAYAPYPGYRPPAGALGEYNGKFMCGQMVLRGGSCVTPRSHIRPTYRNFYHPEDRWPFSGFRLARDL